MSFNSGIGSFGTLAHLILPFSNTGVIVLVSCPPTSLPPDSMLLAAGVDTVVSDLFLDLVTGKASESLSFRYFLLLIP